MSYQVLDTRPLPHPQCTGHQPGTCTSIHTSTLSVCKQLMFVGQLGTHMRYTACADIATTSAIGSSVVGSRHVVKDTLCGLRVEGSG